MMKQNEERPTEAIMLRVPPSLRQRIEQAAAAEDRSVANLARRALRRYIGERNGEAA